MVPVCRPLPDISGGVKEAQFGALFERGIIDGFGQYGLKMAIFPAGVPCGFNLLVISPWKSALARAGRAFPLGLGGQHAAFPSAVSICFIPCHGDDGVLVSSAGRSIFLGGTIWVLLSPLKAFTAPVGVIFPAILNKTLELCDADFGCVNLISRELNALLRAVRRVS